MLLTPGSFLGHPASPRPTPALSVLHLCVLLDEHLCFNLNCVGLFKKWLKASYPTPASSEGAARLHLLPHKWVFTGATFRVSCWHHLLLTVYFLLINVIDGGLEDICIITICCQICSTIFLSAVVAKLIVTHHSEWPQDGAVGF